MFCLLERLSKVLDEEKRPTFRLVLVEISGIGPLLFVCLKDSQNERKNSNLSVGVGGDKRDRTAVVCLPERLSVKKENLISEEIRFGGDKRDRTADLLNAIQALSRLDRLHTPLNRANRAFNTRDTPPKAAKPSAFFLKFNIAGARPHINTKFENKLDTAIPFSHGIISLFHSERGC